MKYQSVTKLELSIKQIKNINDFPSKINVFTRGEDLELERIAQNIVQGKEEIIYMSQNTADGFRITFERNGLEANVIETSFSKV